MAGCGGFVVVACGVSDAGVVVDDSVYEMVPDPGVIATGLRSGPDTSRASVGID